MRCAILFLALGLAACASVDPRPALEQTADLAGERLGFEVRGPQDPEALARELLKLPLDGEAAAHVALLRNRAFLSQIEELGLAQADYAQATRLANPTFAASRRRESPGSGVNVELSLAADVLDWLVQPARKRLAAVELEAAKLRLGQGMLDLVAEARAAVLELQAAEATRQRFQVKHDLAAAAAELARRQRQAGNLEEREVARLEAAAAEELLELVEAELAVGAAREQMGLLLGLSGEELGFRVAPGPPALPSTELDLTQLEKLALENRLDLAAARFGVDLVGKALALKRGTRFFPVGIEVGVEREKEADGVRLTGPHLSIALPIFDTGAASIAKLEAEERKARRQLEQLGLEVASEVRLARAEVLGARRLVETYQQTLMPKRRAGVEQTLLSYNMMLLGVYDLLEARHEEAAAERDATLALRDYWLARTRLERAVGRRLEEPSGGKP